MACSQEKSSDTSRAYVRPIVEQVEEKLIFLQTFKLKKPGAEDSLNEWYLVKQTSDGTKMFRVFEDIPPYNPGGGLLHTSCEAVGSFLYNIGGYNFNEENYSNAVVYLDTCNPCEGWKNCFSLPFACSKAATGVCGRWMYVILGERQRFKPLNPCPTPWGYVFNIDTKEGYFLEPPSCSSFSIDAIATLESGLLVYMPENTFYHQDPLRQSWTVYDQDKTNPLRELDAYVVSDGILYMLDSESLRLYVYDLKLRDYLPTFQLPITLWFDQYQIVHLVSVSNGKLCLIWGDERTDLGCVYVYYTKFSVCYNHSIPHVVVEDEQIFIIDGRELINCVAVDPCADGDACSEPEVACAARSFSA